MNKKIIIAALFILALAGFALIAFAEDSFITTGDSSIKVGEKLNFRIDLEKITEEEFGAYKITIEIAPNDPLAEEPVMDLDLKENVDLTVNKVTGKYAVVSADVIDLKALNFTVRTNESIEDAIEYSVTANVIGEYGEAEGAFTFLLEPADEPIDDPEDDPTDDPADDPADVPEDDPADDANEEEPTSPSDTSDAGDVIDDGGASEEGDDIDEAERYKGSSDNYLSELSVAGYEFTQPFHKTRAVYFVDVEGEVTSLNVTAVPSDKAARVDIAGESNVGADYSKIVVDVRAVSGEMRTYTIYVRHH